MAKVNIRFSVFSKKEKQLDLLEKYLVKPDNTSIIGQPIILSDGSESGKIYKETSFDYKYELTEITDIEDCNNKWLQEWGEHHEILNTLAKDFGFSLHLDYEIIIYNNEYPALYFQPEFMSFLGGIGITFSFYFYND